MISYRNLQTYFHSKSFIKAILISLLFFSGHVAKGRSQPPKLALKLFKIRVFNQLSNASITSEKYNETGGVVEINVSGNAFNLCPGGAEKLRFTWSFDRNVSVLVGGVSASLEAGQVTYSRPCTSGLAGRSEFTISGSSGVVSPFSAEESRDIDSDAFYQPAEKRGRVWANQDSGRTVGVFGVELVDRPLNQNDRFAWFEIIIGTPGGSIRFVYLYEAGTGSSGNVSVEYDTDRPGADYRNFEISGDNFEVCRKACEVDANCKAYTYVKPGVQGPNARCWLKSSVPGGGTSSCCISGTKQ